jgi:hypothetical protein
MKRDGRTRKGLKTPEFMAIRAELARKLERSGVKTIRTSPEGILQICRHLDQEIPWQGCVQTQNPRHGRKEPSPQLGQTLEPGSGHQPSPGLIEVSEKHQLDALSQGLGPFHRFRIAKLVSIPKGACVQGHAKGRGGELRKNPLQHFEVIKRGRISRHLDQDAESRIPAQDFVKVAADSLSQDFP